MVCGRMARRQRHYGTLTRTGRHRRRRAPQDSSRPRSMWRRPSSHRLGRSSHPGAAPHCRLPPWLSVAVASYCADRRPAYLGSTLLTRPPAAAARIGLSAGAATVPAPRRTPLHHSFPSGTCSNPDRCSILGIRCPCQWWRPHNSPAMTTSTTGCMVSMVVW